MYILLSTFENMIFSVVIILTSILVIVFLLWVIRKESKRYKKDKYQTFNDITTFEDLTDLIEFRISKETQCYFSLMYLSIDQFDQIGSYIQEEGVFKYLQKIGHALRMNLPRGAKFAQTKERETFLIYIPELLSDEKTLEYALKFKQAASKKMGISNDLQIKRNVTVAHVSYHNSKETMEMLFLKLKQALYAGKRENGNTISFYEDSMNQNEDTLKHYKQMKDAFKLNQIKTTYSPIFDTFEDKCYGLDVEVTYEKGPKEVLSYKEFMPLLETTGDAFWINQQLLEKSLEDIFDLYQSIKNKSFYIFIKTSVVQLSHEDITSLIDEKVRKYQYDPSKICLYLPLLQNAFNEPKLAKNIMAFKNLGYKVAIDYQQNLDVLVEYSTMLQADFVKVNHQVLSKAHEQIRSYLGDRIEIVSTQVDQVDYKNNIAYKDVSFYQGQILQTKLTKDELLPYVSKNRL